MTQPTTNPMPSAPDRARATSVLDARRSVLQLIPANEILRARVSWEGAWELTAGLDRQFRDTITARGDLSEEAWQKAQADLAELTPAATCYFAAQEVIEAGQPSDRVARKRVLQKKVRAHDAFLSKWGRPAFEDDPSESAIVAAIVPGSGTADDAQDTVAWVSMWRRHSDAMAKSPVTSAYLDEAEADATELLPLIAADDRDSAARDLARRAFTYWSKLYNRLVKVGRFLGPDGLEWNGISSPRASSPSKDDATDEGTTTDTSTTTSSSTTTTPAAPTPVA